MRVAIYERVSSDGQRERETILSQRDSNDRFLAHRADFQVYKRYQDDGVSGSIPLSQRPDGAKLMADAVAGNFDAVIVTRADRLGRDAIDLMQVRAFFEALGISLIGSMEPLDDEFGFDMLAVVSKHEKKRFLKRSREGMERAAREGRYCGGIVPFGYIVPDKKEKARLVPDEAPFWNDQSPAALVRWMYELAGIEKWSPARVAEYLTTLGVPTHYAKDNRQAINPRRGKRKENTDAVWRASRVRSLLLNTVYKGVYRYGKNPPKRKDGTKPEREIIEGKCEALVSPELWAAATAAMSSRMHWNPKAHKKHLLCSLAKCAGCGLNYSGGDSRGRSWYKCGGRLTDRVRHHGPCDSVGLDGAIIEPLIKRDICEFLLWPGEVLDDLAAEVGREPERAVDEAERVIIEAKLATIATRKTKAIKLNLAEIIDEESLAEQLSDIEAERAALERRLAEIPVKRGPKAECPVLAEDLLEQLREKVEEGFSWDQWRDLFTTLVKRVVVHTERHDDHVLQRVVIEYNFAPQEARGVSIATDTG